MSAFRFFTIAVLLLVPSLARSQQFADVVIRPSKSNGPDASRLQVLPNGDVVGHSVAVVDLIGLAYGVPSNPSPRLAALPDWTVRQRFDVNARSRLALTLNTMDISAQRRAVQLLLQRLLLDHFDLVIKMRTMITPVYVLSLSLNDQKLTRSSLDPMNCIFDSGSSGCHTFAGGFGHPLNAEAADMSDLALYLENWTDLPVIDRTATSGLFTMHSKGWRPWNLPPPPPGASGTGAEFANLPTLPAVLSSFGLQLDRREESVAFYTIERIDHTRISKLSATDVGRPR